MALRGGGSGKGKDRGKGRGRGRTMKDLGQVEESFGSQESQESSSDKELDDMHDYDQDGRSDDIDVDGSAGAGDDEGVLDVMARFRGDHKQECKFIVVTGELCTQEIPVYTKQGAPAKPLQPPHLLWHEVVPQINHDRLNITTWHTPPHPVSTRTKFSIWVGHTK